MPTFHFNIISSQSTVIDVEGTTLMSLETARHEAILDARAMMSTAILEGDDISSNSIEICNDDGDVLLMVGFKEAINC